MNGRLSAAALIAKHGDRVASVAADSVHHSQRMTAMLQSLMVNKTSHLLFTLCVLCLFFSTGCAFSKNLLGKSNLQNPALPPQAATSPGTANPDCAVPNTQPKPAELTAYPVAPQSAAQATATANVVPVHNGTAQQPVMQQPATQPQQYALPQPAQQPQFAQQQPAMQQPAMQQQYIQQPQPAAPQQTLAFVQQPAQPQYVQPMQAAVVGTATQGQPQATQPQPNQLQAVAEISPEPNQVPSSNPNAQLPTATISPYPNHPKDVGGPEMTAAPVAAYRLQTRPGGTAVPNCPPGTVPNYGYVTDTISSPEKLAECEKQVFEMNRKLSALQFDTIKATSTMAQMAEQQKQLMIDNERLRRRAEMADKRYLEELDSLSEIVGEVVSQTGSGNKSSSASKPSRSANPLRPVPQSATGQSL